MNKLFIRLALVAVLAAVCAPFTAAKAETVNASVIAYVRNVTQSTDYAKNVPVAAGDRVAIKFTVTSYPFLDQATATITLPNNLTYIAGSIKSDNVPTNGFVMNAGNGGSYGMVGFGTLSRMNTHTITLDAYASSAAAGTITISLGGNGAGTASDSVTVSGGSAVNNVLGAIIVSYPGVSLSVSATNVTKNANAATTVAGREDYITYTLAAHNGNNSPVSNFVFQVDLSQVLPFADLVDNGGGTVSGTTIAFPGLDIPAGATVTKSFEVRVKYALSSGLAYIMKLSYGNTVEVHINQGQVKGAYYAPRTGADTLGFIFALVLTALFALYRNRKRFAAVITGY